MGKYLSVLVGLVLFIFQPHPASACIYTRALLARGNRIFPEVYIPPTPRYSPLLKIALAAATVAVDGVAPTVSKTVARTAKRATSAASEGVVQVAKTSLGPVVREILANVERDGMSDGAAFTWTEIERDVRAEVPSSVQRYTPRRLAVARNFWFGCEADGTYRLDSFGRMFNMLHPAADDGNVLKISFVLHSQASAENLWRWVNDIYGRMVTSYPDAKPLVVEVLVVDRAHPSELRFYRRSFSLWERAD